MRLFDWALNLLLVGHSGPTARFHPTPTSCDSSTSAVELFSFILLPASAYTIGCGHTAESHMQSHTDGCLLQLFLRLGYNHQLSIQGNEV